MFFQQISYNQCAGQLQILHVCTPVCSYCLQLHLSYFHSSILLTQPTHTTHPQTYIHAHSLTHTQMQTHTHSHTHHGHAHTHHTHTHTYKPWPHTHTQTHTMASTGGQLGDLFLQLGTEFNLCGKATLRAIVHQNEVGVVGIQK